MSLKEAFKDYFKVGAAVAIPNLDNEAHRKLMVEQFNTLTCENHMKPSFFLDEKANLENPEKYNLAPAMEYGNAVRFMDFAKENGIPMRGHTLVWHIQTPNWFFHEMYNVEKPYASKEVMLSRMENYIKCVLTFTQKSYPGLFYAWDVVNEVVDEGDFRNSLWYRTVGTDFFIYAFTFARKYAAPGTKLFYNDYESALPWKRDFIIKNVLKPLIERGLVDGMGMQSHLLMDHPDLELYKKAMWMYGELGIEVQVTELDMHNADPSEESMQALADRYRQFFEIYVEAKKSGKVNLTAVTFWNVVDENSWLSMFRKETSYPLLFRGDGEYKKAYYEVLKAAE